MRKIEQKMIDFIDAKLLTNGAAQKAIAEKNARKLMIYAAEACVGIREATGNNDGPMVELIQETIGGHSNESWCMSFVQTCIAYAEVKTGVMSPIAAGEHCLTVWRDTPKIKRVQRFPAPGAIIIWQHYEDGVRTENGHTGFMTEWKGSMFESVEGNTTHGKKKDGSIVREGGGVYQNDRSASADGTMKVVGHLIPF
jgi:hypothetical protein